MEPQARGTLVSRAQWQLVAVKAQAKRNFVSCESRCSSCVIYVRLKFRWGARRTYFMQLYSIEK